ncbi:MAG: DNA topoisomerase IV subunit A [Acholeplasma sp.]|nr:DNA topoisomerase IV subunit A [Acholeplasma sp.]
MSKKTIDKKIDAFIEEKITTERLEDIIGERFGRYSKYIIQDRALPDARDGLKPVQRRILYAMYKMGMFNDKPFKKSARIAGEVMGKYHPHGDSSIYEAMVRMSQNFKVGVTLIEMHGNNGSIDGDSAAAMRYTEARLSKEAEYLIADIDKRTVPFIPNFDDEELEPTVLPAKFPNLLVNGANGISAGYATKIPPHNLKEVIKATIERIDKPDLSIDRIMKIILGPDFPTGGIVQGKEGIRQAFEKGSGKVIVRSKTYFEPFNKDQVRIVVSEIPYEVNKAELVKSIDLLRIDKKLEDLQEVRDESDREGLRISIELKKDANPEVCLAYLLKNTDLQVNFNYNMVAIHHQRPVQMGILDIIDAYINHQKEVITNRSNYELDKAEKRLHIVSGLIKMVDVIDEVIKIIRQSKNKQSSKDNIIKSFGFSELQAEAIVTLQLYRLSSTDINALIKEANELEERITWLKQVLSDEQMLLSVIKKELKEVSNKVGTPRKTMIEEAIETIKIEKADLISDEQVRVGVTKDGYIKRSNLRSYIASRQPGLKEQDGMLFDQEVSTKDTLLMFTTLGNYIYLPVFELEEMKWKDLGAFINNIVPIEKNELIIRIFAISNFKVDTQLLLVTEQGRIKQTKLIDFEVSRYSKTIRAMKIQEGDELASVDFETKNNIIVFTKEGNALRFHQTDVPVYGTQSNGILSVKLNSTDKVVKAIYAKSSDDIVILTSLGNIKRDKVENLPISKRLRAMTEVIKLRKRNPHHIRDVSRISIEQYKENVDVLVTAKLGSVSLKAEDIKSSAEYGKPFVDSNTYGKSLFITINKASFEENDIEIIEKGETELVIKPKKDKPKKIKEVLVEKTLESPKETITVSNDKASEVNTLETSMTEDKKIHIKKLSLFEDDDWKE